MAVILAGIDEAGYGPTLGPLCVAMSAFRVEGWSPGMEAPDLWRLLSAAVCRASRDAMGRVAIADSKKLKLPNDALERATPVDPLVHLERGVLAMLRAGGQRVESDEGLLEALGAGWPEWEWYRGVPSAVGRSCGEGRLGVDASCLAGAMERAGVRFEGAWVEVIDEGLVNETILATGTKAEATAIGVGRHLRRAWERWGRGAAALRVVSDQLGGRTRYEGLLARELGPMGVSVAGLSEGSERSRYALLPMGVESCGEALQRSVVQFMPEAEGSHLPVALASMCAKLVRELLMRRFNAYWGARCAGLRPTAGYATDARRWLAEVSGVLTAEERRALVRIG